jgi:hypothetical protein
MSAAAPSFNLNMERIAGTAWRVKRSVCWGGGDEDVEEDEELDWDGGDSGIKSLYTISRAWLASGTIAPLSRRSWRY